MAELGRLWACVGADAWTCKSEDLHCADARFARVVMAGNQKR